MYALGKTLNRMCDSHQQNLDSLFIHYKLLFRADSEHCHRELEPDLIYYLYSKTIKESCLVVLHRLPLILKNWKNVFTVQKYTTPNFQNSPPPPKKKCCFFFFLEFSGFNLNIFLFASENWFKLV